MKGRRRNDTNKAPKVIKAEVRLLHRNPGMAPSHYEDETDPKADWGERDYTSRLDCGMREEPESIDVWNIDRMTNSSRTSFSALKAEEFARREVRSLQEKMRSLTRRARSNGIDLEPELERVRAALEDAQRKVDG